MYICLLLIIDCYKGYIAGDTGDNCQRYLNDVFEFFFPHIQVIYPTAPVRYIKLYTACI